MNFFKLWVVLASVVSVVGLLFGIRGFARVGSSFWGILQSALCLIVGFAVAPNVSQISMALLSKPTAYQLQLLAAAALLSWGLLSLPYWSGAFLGSLSRKGAAAVAPEGSLDC